MSRCLRSTEFNSLDPRVQNACDQQERVPAAFGATKYRYLQALKQRYNPTNFFSFNLNISPQ